MPWNVEIEILRRVAAVGHRPVLDQRLRIDHAVFEAKTVDERLERRAGRAQRLRHVDLAGAAQVEIIGRADAGQNIAGCIVDGEDGERDIRAERGGKRADALAREIFQILLYDGVDGEPMHFRLRGFGDDPVGDVRRQHRHRAAAGRHRLGFGERDLVGRDHAGRGKAVEHAVARRARDLGKPIRPAQLRRLRQCYQERRFAKRQPPRLFAEIGERRGADALDVAAIGRKIEIEREDLVLGQRTLDLDRAHHLAQFCHHAAAHFGRLQQPRHLHGQGRGAGAKLSAGCELQRRAQHRPRIDAVMDAETLVLIGEQHVEETRIDVGDRRRQPPAAFARRISAQQAPFPIDHAGREIEVLAERRRTERSDPPRRAGKTPTRI